MRILITTDWYKPVINGVVTSILNLSEGLRKRGHEVKILTLSSDCHYYEEDNVIYMGSFGMGCIYPNARVKIPLFHKELKKLIDWKPDIIHQKANKIEWRKRLCQKYNIPEDKYVLLYVGRLAKEKNIEELLYFQKKTAAYGTVLVLVGDGPARKELEEYTKNLGIEDSVYFLGMVAPEQVGKYYRAGDLFVSASTSETQGLTYAEALASGLPLLCRKDECLDALVTEKENGWQYKDEQSFIDKLQEWIHLDKEEKERMSYKAEKSIDALAVDVFVEAVEQLYKREKEWWDYAA